MFDFDLHPVFIFAVIGIVLALLLLALAPAIVLLIVQFAFGATIAQWAWIIARVWFVLVGAVASVIAYDIARW